MTYRARQLQELSAVADLFHQTGRFLLLQAEWVLVDAQIGGIPLSALDWPMTAGAVVDGDYLVVRPLESFQLGSMDAVLLEISGENLEVSLLRAEAPSDRVSLPAWDVDTHLPVGSAREVVFSAALDGVHSVLVAASGSALLLAERFGATLSKSVWVGYCTGLTPAWSLGNSEWDSFPAAAIDLVEETGETWVAGISRAVVTNTESIPHFGLMGHVPVSPLFPVLVRAVTPGSLEEYPRGWVPGVYMTVPAPAEKYVQAPDGSLFLQFGPLALATS